MQVIYSAGTSPQCSPIGTRRQFQPYHSAHHSPHSSPRNSRAGLDGAYRPVLPGYTQPGSRRGSRESYGDANARTEDSTLKKSIPLMPRPLAITCLILNILFPGLGTFVSGISVLCCSNVRVDAPGEKWRVVRVNTWVAFLQFITAFLFLMGWIWSIMWGACFLTATEEHKEELAKKAKHDEENLPMTSQSHTTASQSNRTASQTNINMSSETRNNRTLDANGTSSVTTPLFQKNGHPKMRRDSPTPKIVLQDYGDTDTGEGCMITVLQEEKHRR